MDSRGVPSDIILTGSSDNVPNERLMSYRLYPHLQGMPIPVCLGWRRHMEIKLSAHALKHEAFVLALLSGMTAADAARKAGYGRKNINVRILAWELLQREDIQRRLREVAEATMDEAIMTIIQRKVRLSEMARENDRPIECIDLLNRMDNLYSKKKLEVNASPITSVAVVQTARAKISAKTGIEQIEDVPEDVPPLGKGKQEEASG